MRVNFNAYIGYPASISMSGSRRQDNSQVQRGDYEITSYIKPLKGSKSAAVPPLSLMKGINPNNKNVFDNFNKIDEVTRQINFVRSTKAWDDCLLEEIEEFTIARLEYNQNPTQQNFDHMEEEMGDIFYTAASIAKDSGINPEEAFRATNRKFYNRINVMEKMLGLRSNGKKSLKDCRDQERRALWNAAKRKIYDAQASRYIADA